MSNLETRVAKIEQAATMSPFKVKTCTLTDVEFAHFTDKLAGVLSQSSPECDEVQQFRSGVDRLKISRLAIEAVDKG